jgi:hypothetical protein
MPKVAIFNTETSKHVADVLYSGFLACGYTPTIHPPSLVGYDILAFYGMNATHSKMHQQMLAQKKKTVIVDAPYFGRNIGYYKVTVDQLHPKYFQKFKHPSDRFNIFNLPVKTMRRFGEYILLAGIGVKSSKYYNIPYQSWDENATKILRKFTSKRILYRPKPNYSQFCRPISGTTWTQPNVDLINLLDKSYAVVTHHSNVAIDGLMRGVPCFAVEGLPSMIGLQDISKINSPKLFSDVEQKQILYDIAYTQWNLDEMASGKMIKHFQNEKLI